MWTFLTGAWGKVLPYILAGAGLIALYFGIKQKGVNEERAREVKSTLNQAERVLQAQQDNLNVERKVARQLDQLPPPPTPRTYKPGDTFKFCLVLCCGLLMAACVTARPGPVPVMVPPPPPLETCPAPPDVTGVVIKSEEPKALLVALTVEDATKLSEWMASDHVCQAANAIKQAGYIEQLTNLLKAVTP